jgi:DNA-directed RNA polymerase subunit RPC12/RpoP
MGFETGKAVMTCSQCGTVHEVRWSRMPVKEATVVRCTACRAKMFDRNTTHDYGDPVRLEQ